MNADFTQARSNLKARSTMFKTWLSAGDFMRQYRGEMRAKYHAEISQELDAKKGEGLYPFEGKWRTLEEITELQKLMRKKDRTIFVDLIVLFIILIFSSFLGSVFIITYLYKQ